MAERIGRSPQEREVLELALELGKSEKRILGWEPTERHEHYDADGKPTGYTIVTREPEWDDLQRRRMLALISWRNGICSGCGVHHSLAESPDFYWTFDERRCPVCADTARFMRDLSARDDAELAKLGDDPRPLDPRPDDGRSVVLREMAPAEVDAAKAKRRI